MLHRHVVRIDADPRRDRHVRAVDEDVEMRVDVIREVLVHLRHEPGQTGAAHRVVRRRPRHASDLRFRHRRRATAHGKSRGAREHCDGEERDEEQPDDTHEGS